MATNINTILGWFLTGKKPTEQQFKASWTSFWHKDEVIPQSSISNLTSVLNTKADKSQFDAHKTDANAHADLFNSKEDKDNKGMPGGYAPLNEVGKLVSNYLVTVNDLITGGGNPLTAEQGKILQGQIDTINALLASDDIDLDTLQEIVDKIKEIQNGLDAFLVNDLVTGGVTKALTAEMGKLINIRLLKLEAKPLPEDFYVATLINSSKLLYKTDTYREIDLQPFVPVTITNTNEIVKNGNDLYIGGNYSGGNTLPVFLLKLSNCRITDNVMSFESTLYTALGVPLHSLIFHNNFLYMASRTTSTTLYKINAYDFNDRRSLALPENASFGGVTGDIMPYKNKIYILVGTNYNQPIKFIEIDEGLYQYRLVFTIPSTPAYATIYGHPFLIYNDELYVPFAVNTTSVAIRVYDMQGNIKRERTGITINTSIFSTIAVPHWMTIFNNKIIISHVFCKSLLRLDCLTLATEESIALDFVVTDDNSIDNAGYVYLCGEKSSNDSTRIPKLVKVKYKDFTDFTVIADPFNNGNGSYGSLNPLVKAEGLNLLEKKDNFLSKTADYQILMSDFPNNNSLVVFADATGGSITITLPLSVSSSGYEIKVMKTDVSANTVTVKGNGAELINASNTQVLAAQYDKITTKSNGVQNFII